MKISIILIPVIGSYYIYLEAELKGKDSNLVSKLNVVESVDI